MKPLPHSFHTTIAATSGVGTAWIVRGDELGDVFCAIPPEFDGPGCAWSPGHLFVGAAASCLAGGFKVLAAKSRLAFSQLHVEGEARLDRDETGEPAVCEITLHARLRLAYQRDVRRAHRLFEKAAASSILARSMKTSVRVTAEITVGEPSEVPSTRPAAAFSSKGAAGRAGHVAIPPAPVYKDAAGQGELHDVGTGSGRENTRERKRRGARQTGSGDQGALGRPHADPGHHSGR